jgi:Cys-rich protein (TIGR01571 family)
MWACDWGGDAGACWECWRVRPCCHDTKSAIYCCLCWWCCGLCSSAKLFSYSVKQNCAVVNHCLPAWCCGICVAVLVRHNIRTQLRVGDTKTTSGWIGDCLLSCCCGPCVLCQELRAVPKDAWDWLPELQKNGLTVMVDPWKFIYVEA